MVSNMTLRHLSFMWISSHDWLIFYSTLNINSYVYMSKITNNLVYRQASVYIWHITYTTGCCHHNSLKLYMLCQFYWLHHNYFILSYCQYICQQWRKYFSCCHHKLSFCSARQEYNHKQWRSCYYGMSCLLYTGG